MELVITQEHRSINERVHTAIFGIQMECMETSYELDLRKDYLNIIQIHQMLADISNGLSVIESEVTA